MRYTPVTPLLLLAALLLTAAAPAHASYTRAVTFKFDLSKATYKKHIDKAYLMLDKFDGLNPISKARPMTRQGNSWTTTVKLTEGDYIYVFVADPHKYVNLANCNLNEDDVPDANFFNDPAPTHKGLGGQYGMDNIYKVRDPQRPQYDPSSVNPKPGHLVKASSVKISVKARIGSGGKPIDASKVKVKLHVNEPPGMFRRAGAPLSDTVTEVKDVKVGAPAGGAVLVTATVSNAPEGFHEVDFYVADTTGRTGDVFTTSVIFNAKNQVPTAHAGPTRFGRVGGEIELDAGESMDPDRVGINKFIWRRVSGGGSGSLTFRAYDQERDFRDNFWVLSFDADGNPKQKLLKTGTGSLTTSVSGARVSASAAGSYKIGLKVCDQDYGSCSAETFTWIHVVQSFSAAVRPKIDVVHKAGTIYLDGRPSGGGSGYRWFQDYSNPAQVSLQYEAGNKIAKFKVPSKAGAYYYYLQIGSSYARTAVVRVDAAGKVSGQMLDDQDRFWKEQAVIYMVFVRMFASSKGSPGACSQTVGGDFTGLTKRLPYLKDLGVNVLWLMPVTPGPTSHGYAATALFDTEEDYGTLADFKKFTTEAHKLGFKVMFDLVANHTSASHPLFKAALANKQSPLRSWFVFNEGNTSRPFEYAFNFATLPSVNYNNPLVRQMFLDVVEFWMEQGVDAFRCDIASFVPPSFWRAARRKVFGRQPGGVMLPEVIPPSPGFHDEQFDFVYHTRLYWGYKDIFAKTGGLDSFNSSLTNAESFVSGAYITAIKEKVDPDNVLFMRYLDTQDEDRYLLQAGRKKGVLKAAAGSLLMLPGSPMINYGSEQGLEQTRGKMLFDGDMEKELHEHFKKLLLIRNNNPGLQGQSHGKLGTAGNSYTRVNNDSDKGGKDVLSFARYRKGQLFVVLSNRFQAGSLGTPVTIYPPKTRLADYGSGTLWLVNHVNPTDQIATDATSLTKGFLASVGSHETKVYQIARHKLPDEDEDTVLDSYDNCRGVKNPKQADTDGDGVGDDCDKCVLTPLNTAVDITGCDVATGKARARYVLDGKVDDSAYKVATGSGMTLYASFNGRQLYVAASAARFGTDVAIMVTNTTATKAAAPLGKKGKAAFTGLFLGDEGDNNYSAWGKATGAADSATPLVHASDTGVVEGTINLVELYGAKLPAKIMISAARYGGGNGGALNGQVPASKSSNGEVDAAEFYTFALSDPTPKPPPKPADGDKDGVYDTKDNCPKIPNADQGDFDGDLVGDLCDLCPATRPGTSVDGYGCAASSGAAFPDPDPGRHNGMVQAEGCQVGAASPLGRSLGALLLLGLALLWRRRAQTRTRR